MTLALDGHATGSWSSGTTITATLTTTNANDVIVLGFGSKASSGTVTLSSISATGVTWQGAVRKSLSSGVNTCAIWLGTAAAALSAVTVTANLSSSNITASGAHISVFGVSGADTTTITDANASLPATNTGSVSSAPSVSGVSTTNANDMIIAVMSNSGNVTETAGSGFTLIDAVASNSNSIGTEYEVVSATQSSISPAFGTACSSWIMIVDAIKALNVSNPNQIVQVRQSIIRAAYW